MLCSNQLSYITERVEIVWKRPRIVFFSAARVKVEWVLRAPAGTEVALSVRHERAGVVRARVVLG